MDRKPTHPPFEAVLAVALVSFCILAAEVALSRVFSVLFRAPYVFLIVSTAIGGLGLGGLLAHGLRPEGARLQAWITGLCVALSAALAAPTLILFALPVGRELVAGAETAVVVVVPMVTFCLAGVLLSLIFRRYAASGGFLYFVDLAAAALAAPAAVVLLNALGGINTPLLLGVAAAVASVVLALRQGSRRSVLLPGVVLVALVGILGSNLATRWIDLPPLNPPTGATYDPAHPWHTITKPLFAELGDPYSGSKIVRTDWTAVSRTDVVFDPSQHQYYIYTDGDVPTQMEAWDGTRESVRQTYGTFIGSLPYRLASTPPERVLAIGAGGGLDVLLARAAGAKTVDAVEINPSIPRIVRDPQFKHTYARVYQEPGVRLVVDEGRSFLQRSGKYDLIYFACAKTATTQTSGVALLDNHLYTIEAFVDYWRHLSDDGLLALVTQEGHLIDRLWLTAVHALTREGLTPFDAARRLLMARVPEERFGMGPYRHALILSRRPWEGESANRALSAIQATGLEPIYVPQLRPFSAGGANLERPDDLTATQRAIEERFPIPADLANPGNGMTAPAHLSAVTDDSPFYVDISRGLHPSLAQLLMGSAAAAVGVIVLVLLAGFREGRGKRAGAPLRPRFLLGSIVYFSMLGAGFMLVELALMQRFILLLGFPTRSLTVTLFALLVGSALGSRMTQRGRPEEAGTRLRKALPLLLLLLVAYRFALPPALELLLPYALWVRVAATVLLLLPIGFLMGMPFPTALRTLETSGSAMIPAFWSVNGVTSILGSVVTMAIAKFAGYGAALLVGAGCYLVAWLVFPFLTAAQSDFAGDSGLARDEEQR